MAAVPRRYPITESKFALARALAGQQRFEDALTEATAARELDGGRKGDEFTTTADEFIANAKAQLEDRTGNP